MSVRGLLTVEDLRASVADGSIDTVICAFADCYGRLVGKRLDAEFFCDSALADGTHACDYLFTVDMEMEPVDGYTFAGWDLGYGDVHLVPDMATLRRCAWLERTALVLCDVDAPVAPRTMLAGQIDRLAELGLRADAASELEYYLYRDTYPAAAEGNYADLHPAGWYIEDYHLLQGARGDDFHGAYRRALAASGIPVESTKGEWGRGQHEINIRYTDVATMADRHTLLKQAGKELADAMGVAVTFMAKPDAAEAGSSCHIHLSLWRDDTNLFADPDGDDFRHFLGGWMTHAADLMVCWAPTVNSYKRYQAQSWAPTALSWSHDNRTSGFRIVGHGSSRRIECRIPGADVNPHLAYAGALAAGLDGLERRLEPPPEFTGDAYGADLPALPRTLTEATERWATSDLARRAFGDDVVDHYAHFFRTEAAAYDAAVTDWERRRYFERI